MATEDAPSPEALLEFYGDGLARIVAAVGPELVRVLADDDVVGSLLLMHDLHPVPLAERVAGALEEVRPYLDSHGGDVELLGLVDGVARLRLTGHCRTCAASTATLEHVVEDALRAAAPDLQGMAVEGLAAPAVPTPGSTAAGGQQWVHLEGAEAIGRGMLVSASQGLLVANVAGTLLAYRDVCAGCGGPLAAEGLLLGGTLTCAGCARSYDLPRAGRCRDDAELQLEPVPLLRGRGGVRVAVADHAAPAEGHRCELCPVGLGDDHRHLLHLDERRIVCVCETCWSIRSGDAEYRATGSRTVWLDDLVLPDEVWAAFGIPIGLAFMMRSGLDGRIVAMYPSPAGATESELDLGAWTRLVALDPRLERLEPDAEALILSRISDPPRYVIAPIDQAYKLVGLIKARWEGISGGTETEDAVAGFFTALRERSAGVLVP